MALTNDSRLPSVRSSDIGWAVGHDKPGRGSRREASVFLFLASLGSWALLIAAASYFL